MDSQEEQKAWKKVKYSQKFLNAFRGMYIVWKTTRLISVHVLSAVAVVIAGFYFNVSDIEWVALIFAIGFVMVSEVFNTAIEIDIDCRCLDVRPCRSHCGINNFLAKDFLT